MASNWDTIRSLALLILPFIIPRALSYYRSIRYAQARQRLAIQPLPRNAAVVLALLGSLSVVYIAKTLPPLAPENIFYRTASRLQIPTDTLFHRVEALRPGNALTARDIALRARLASVDARLLYFNYGPDVLADCPFCNSDEPQTFFYYALPALLAPHVANLVVLATSTSSSLVGPSASQWRRTATLAAVGLAAVDIYWTNSYNHQANRRAARLQDLDMFFWTMRTVRLLALAALDAGLAALLWLSATNRAFGQLPSAAERVDDVARALHAVKSKLSALGIVKNTALRDDDLRGRGQAYWTHEVRLMREVMEEREVIEGVNDALENRINIQNITRDADAYAQNVLQPLQTSTSG